MARYTAGRNWLGQKLEDAERVFVRDYPAPLEVVSRGPNVAQKIGRVPRRGLCTIELFKQSVFVCLSRVDGLGFRRSRYSPQRGVHKNIQRL